MFTLVEGSLRYLKQKNELISLLTEHSVPREEIEEVLPVLLENEEVLNEFFGGLGKASSWLGSKLSGAGAKMTAHSNRKALGREQKKAKFAHRSSVKAYGKALKGNDPEARKKAMLNMVTQRNNSRMTRGKSRNLGVKKSMGKTYYMEPTNKKIYKRLGEVLLAKAGIKLNE